MLNRSSSLPSLRWSRFLASSICVEVLVQFLLGEERRAVDALQLLVVLVALPVGAGDREQLERLDLRGVRHVRAAAEIDEVRPQRVFGEDLAGALRRSARTSSTRRRTCCSPSSLRRQNALVGEVALLDLPHLLLDLLQVLGRERRGRGRNRSRSRCRWAARCPAWSRDTVPARPRPAGARSSAGRPPAPRDPWRSGSAAWRPFRWAG